MKTLTIRGLPDEVHARLSRRAKENRRSLNQEVISRLVEQGEVRQEEHIEEVLRVAREIRRGVAKPLTAAEIEMGISEGRL